MTPEALEWLRVAAELAAPACATIGAGVKLLQRLARQDAELAAQSRQLEWQSRMLEMVGRRQGTIPPPRPKLTTLEEPFEAPPEDRRPE